MRYAIIKDGKVINVVIAKKADDVILDADCTIKMSTSANITDSYIDGAFIPVIHEYISPEQKEANKLQSDIDNLSECKKRELKIAMYNLGQGEMFEAFRNLEDFDLTNDFVFNDSIVEQAMSQIEPELLKSIKEQIINNRSAL